MSDPLFRAGVDPYRVIDHPTPALADIDRAAWLFLAGLGVVLIGSLLMPFADIERLDGAVRDDVGMRLGAARAGYVSQVFHAEGDRVRKDEPILVVSSPTATRASSLEAQLAASARVRGVLAQVSEEEQEVRLAADRRRLAGQRAALGRRQDALEAQARLQDRRIEAARRQFEALAPLKAQGFVSEPEYRAREGAWMSEAQTAEGLKAQLAQVEGELVEVVAQERLAVLETRQRERDLRDAKLGHEENAMRFDSAAEIVVRATADSLISNLAVSQGQSVTPGQTLVQLDSAEGLGFVTLRASSKAVERIRPGQSVRLTFSGVSRRQQNTGRGEVSAIARSPSAPSGDYVVTVRITAFPKGAKGAERRPPAGSRAEAAVIVDRRSLLSRLLAPLGRAFFDRVAA